MDNFRDPQCKMKEPNKKGSEIKTEMQSAKDHETLRKHFTPLNFFPLFWGVKYSSRSEWCGVETAEIRVML